MVAADPPATRARFEYKWRVALIVVIGLFLSVLDNTIISVALPNMRQAFHTDFATITWVATAYFLAQAAVIPVTGYLSDRWGMKPVFVTGLGIFLVGSLLCAAAPNQTFLIVSRVVQGIGGGALMPTSFALAYRAFPRDEWGRATTIIGIPVLLAPVLGPVIGGYLTTEIQWRAIFAINLPVGFIGFALALWLLAPGGTPLESEAERHPFDVPGLVLSMSGFTILIYGLLQAGTHGWTSRSAVTALLLGLVLILVLGVVEYRTRGPVLDIRLFHIGTFTMANVLLWLVVAGFYGTLFLIPFYFENIQGTSALTAGEIMIGQGLASAVGIAMAGELYNKVGPRLLVTTGVLALAISMIGFTHLTMGTTGLSLQGWMVLRGLGLGLTTIPLQNLALSVVRHRDVARASSLVNVTRQVFSAAGLATLTAYVTQNGLHHAAALSASVQAHRPASAVQACLTTPSGPSTCIRHQAIVMGLNDAFMLVLIVSAVGVLVALVLGHDPSLVALKTMTPERLAEIFPHLPKLELVEVTSRMQPRWFEAGETIVREGDLPEYFYILARGEVKVTALNGDGHERELRRMEPGEFFGEIGLLGNRPRTATVTASEPSQLLLMDQATFVELVRGSAPTKDQLARVMGERLAVVP